MNASGVQSAVSGQEVLKVEDFRLFVVLRSIAIRLAILLGVGFWFAGGLPSFTDNQLAWLVIFVISVSYGAYSIVEKWREKAQPFVAKIEARRKELLRHREAFEQEKVTFRAAMRERATGVPTLVRAIDEYQRLADEALAVSLERKRHPALKAAEVLRTEAGRRRAAEREAKISRSILEYYEYVAPFLLDLREDPSTLDEEVSDEAFAGYSEDERKDETTRYLTIDEYRRLPEPERNQRALERYWTRAHSSREIGRMYERYVGYLYELAGYKVQYTGIVNGLEDLGRDLVCSRGEETVVVQCKNWSRNKVIHEKHIFQLYGSIFLYQRDHRNETVSGAFFTTTGVSSVAQDAAEFLEIDVVDNHEFDRRYPCIKCNIGRNHERIYHLPFDQQYDKVKVELSKGEMYCSTVTEAVAGGFRRALRYRGSTSGRMA
jgi:hypothetical protein